MSNLSRRTLVAGAAAISAVVALPAAALADPTGSDAELLKLGAELARIGKEWLAQRAVDASDHALFEARCEAAGLPPIEPVSTADEEKWEEWRAYEDKRLALLQSRDPDLLVWGDINDRMYDIIDKVFEHPPQTLAGLAVQAHALVLSRSEWWDGYEDNQREARSFLENFCTFAGITPEPTQETGAVS
jgi:hypothetical protein